MIGKRYWINFNANATQSLVDATLRGITYGNGCYANGAGVVQNYSEAIALFEEAAAANNARAINDLAFAYAEGHGVARDIERTQALEGLPAC